MLTHPAQASPKQDRDPSHHPTTASKHCSSPRRGAGKLGAVLLPAPRVRGRGSPVPRSLARGIPAPPKRRRRHAGFKGTVQSRSCSHPDAQEQLSRAPQVLQRNSSLLQNEGRDLFPPSPPVSPSHSPGPRAPPSQPKQARLPINKDEEAPSHLDPFSFFSHTLSKWAEGQGYRKRPSAGVLIALAENTACGAAEPISGSLPYRQFKTSHGGPSVTSIS